MRYIKVSVLILCGLLAFAPQANALLINPTICAEDDPDCMWSGPETGQATINGLIAGIIYGETGEYPVLQYKNDVDYEPDNALLPLAGSYNTEYFNDPDDPEEATITWVPGTAFIDPAAPSWLLVKDGNHDPGWYLFSLQCLGWNGTDNLELVNFWPGRGAISHVAIYGSAMPVPEPASIMLVGAGLLGLAAFTRKRLLGH